MNEFEVIEALRRLFRHTHRSTAVGIGDDAAALYPSPKQTVVSVDAAVEGTHFKRPWLTEDQLGHRSTMAAASDLAAMGSPVSSILFSLVVPQTLSDRNIVDLGRGVERAARELDAEVVGGNLATGPRLTLHITVLGRVDRPVTRAGARPGDVIQLTGPVGAAALGLHLLLATERQPYPKPQRALVPEDARHWVDQWIARRARTDWHRPLRDHATAAIDISDGTAQDLAHLCRASGVGAHIKASQLPTMPHFQAACVALGLDPLTLCLQGGEDYEILFTAPQPLPHAHPIGHVTSHPDELLIEDHQGRVRPQNPLGHRHR